MAWIVGRSDKKASLSDFKLLGWLFGRYGTRRKKAFLFLTIFSFGSFVTELIFPLLLKFAIDDYILTKKIQGLYFIIGLYAVFIVIGMLFMGFRQYFNRMLAAYIAFDVREDLFKKFHSLSMDFYDKHPSGKLISRSTSDVENLSNMLGQTLIESVFNIFLVISIYLVLFQLNLVIGLSLLLIAPLTLLILFVFRRIARPAYDRTRKTIAALLADTQENLEGLRVTKAFSREELNLKRFQQLNQENYSAYKTAAFYTSLIFPTFDLLTGMGIVFILFLGAPATIAGTLTIGELAASIAYLQRLLRPILFIVVQYNDLQSGLAATVRIHEIVTEKPTVQQHEELLPANFAYDSLKGELSIQNLRFEYVPGVPVYKDFSLHIPARQSIAIVGHTGAGKSTLVNILLRFYEYKDGLITLDGIDIRKFPLKKWYELVGYVDQNNFLFSRSIKDNLLYGNPHATIDDVKRVLRQIGLEHYVNALPEGIDTIIGERGATLSEGQRQLLCLGRALLKNPKILILDEATSSVDSYTEFLIQKTLETQFKDKTLIVIAHRLSTLKIVDRIVVIEKGTIVEEGTFYELVRKEDGKFTRLYKQQVLATLT